MLILLCLYCFLFAHKIEPLIIFVIVGIVLVFKNYLKNINMLHNGETESVFVFIYIDSLLVCTNIYFILYRLNIQIMQKSLSQSKNRKSSLDELIEGQWGQPSQFLIFGQSKSTLYNLILLSPQQLNMRRDKKLFDCVGTTMKEMAGQGGIYRAFCIFKAKLKGKGKSKCRQFQDKLEGIKEIELENWNI